MSLGLEKRGRSFDSPEGLVALFSKETTERMLGGERKREKSSENESYLAAGRNGAIIDRTALAAVREKEKAPSL